MEPVIHEIPKLQVAHIISSMLNAPIKREETLNV
jgi:hypothetical protein